MTSLKNTIVEMLPRPLRLRVLRWQEQRNASDNLAASILGLGEFEGFLLAYRSHTADEKIIRSSFANDIFFPAIPDYHPDVNDVILDVGAHIGTFSLLAAGKVAGGRVIAVEASLETSNLLKINAKLNGCSNITALHLALSDRAGEAQLYHSVGNWGHSITSRLSRRVEVCPAETLSGLMKRENLDEIALAKFNCEGAEFPILLGTPPEELQKIRRMLVLYHGDLYAGKNVADLERHLSQAGFVAEYQKQTRDRGWMIARRS